MNRRFPQETTATFDQIGLRGGRRKYPALRLGKTNWARSFIRRPNKVRSDFLWFLFNQLDFGRLNAGRGSPHRDVKTGTRTPGTSYAGRIPSPDQFLYRVPQIPRESLFGVSDSSQIRSSRALLIFVIILTVLT